MKIKRVELNKKEVAPAPTELDYEQDLELLYMRLEMGKTFLQAMITGLGVYEVNKDATQLIDTALNLADGFLYTAFQGTSEPLEEFESEYEPEEEEEEEEVETVPLPALKMPTRGTNLSSRKRNRK